MGGDSCPPGAKVQLAATCRKDLVLKGRGALRR